MLRMTRKKTIARRRRGVRRRNKMERKEPATRNVLT